MHALMMYGDRPPSQKPLHQPYSWAASAAASVGAISHHRAAKANRQTDKQTNKQTQNGSWPTSGSPYQWKHWSNRQRVVFPCISRIQAAAKLGLSLKSCIFELHSRLERQSLAGKLSLSHARLAADGWPLMWVNHPLHVSQLGQLNLWFYRGR